LALSTQYRLKKRAQYLHIYENGIKVYSDEFVLYGVCGCKTKKIGSTVSRKIGNAVVRNKVRRRLAEIVRLHIDWFPNDCWFVINAKRRIVEADFHRLESAVRRALDRWCEKSAAGID